MASFEHWQEGARAAYEEMSALQAAGADADDLTRILDKLTAAHGDNAGTPEDISRVAGYLEMTGDIAARLLYQRDADLEAELDAEAGM